MTRLLLHHPASSILLTGLGERFHPGLLPVVPNVQAGRDVRGSLRGAGRAITLTQWAREALQDAGWRPLRPGEREAFFRNALSDLSLDYLGPLMDRPGTLTRLSKLVGELLRDHLDPAEVQAVAADARQRDVATVYAAYVGRAQAERRFDLPGTEYFASRLPSLRVRAAAVHGFVYFDASQVAFLGRALASGSLVTLPLERGVPALRRTEETFQALQGAGFQPQAITGLPSRNGDRLVQAYLTRAPVPGGVSKAEFAEIEAEVRACLGQVRAWLAQGSRPEQVAIVVRHEATYLPTLADVAREYAMPLVSGLQVPLLETPLGGAVQAWVDAHTRNWTYAAVARLLTLPLLRPPFDALRQARRLRPACPPGLDAWGDLGWLALPPETTWRAGIGVLQRLLTEFGVSDRCQQDPGLNVALRILVDRLEAEARRDKGCSREELLGLVTHVLRTATVPALLGRSGVRVANPIAALGRRFDHVWVLGLSDGLFPVRPSDDPLLDSTVRAEWRDAGVNIPDVTSLATVQEALFLGSVAGAWSDIVLSRPRRDAGGRELRASPYWLRLGGAAEPAALPYGSEAERALAAALGGDVPPAVRERQAAEVARAGGLVGAYQGQLAEGIDVNARRWSPSQLHAVGACRFRWFTQKLLGLEEGVDPDADEDRRVTGTLLHAALEGALQDWQPGDAPEVLAERAEAALHRSERELRRLGTLRPGPLWPTQLEEVRRTALKALRSDAFLPPGWRPLAREETREFTLEVGPHIFQFRGIVDRVDETPHGLTVTDYKTGSYISRVVQGGVMNLEVQLPLYLHATGAVSGRYLSVEGGKVLKQAGRAAEGGRSKYDWTEHQAQVQAFLRGLGDALAAGNIAPSPDTRREACTYCGVRAVCRVAGGAVEVSA
ncbi:PD-(D/E)XK nuclease family protein [Deinococcus sp. NW-56]|uniref:PD-(D/E)XK nuclease family protein n=1 Tax=Deinococcus sp. NW-56 TaxID=2080419 RepID=UPI000CF441F2|nr:PD-(D/E)XK nuclease family protein [Deinococcus sp. NW-56]